MALATLVTGYADLADWLMLLAVVLFVAAGVLAITDRPDPSKGSLVAFGLAAMALALLVL